MGKGDKMAAGFWRRHRGLKWSLGIGVGVLALIAVALLILARHAEPLLRARIIQGLEDQFHAHVELDSFHVALREGLWAEGKGLRIWQPVEARGLTETAGEEPPAVGKPLVQVSEFRFQAPLRFKAGMPIRIPVVQLKGLIVDIPPRRQFNAGSQSTAGANRQSIAQAGGKRPDASPSQPRLLNFIIESLDCRDSRLTLETSNPAKLPREFEIAHLRLTGLQSNQPVAFDAELTNPRPKGVIHTHGNAGPWDVPDPGETPLNGDYRFEHANLGDFKGIAGTLSSDGHYQGTLRNITVDGETSTPDFQLERFKTPVPLDTRFHALVDGTNGDTQLDPVDAQLGHSHIQVRGQVVRVTAVENGVLVGRGHDIQVNMTVDRGLIQDFLRLMSHSGAPLLTGALEMNGKLHIPPGAAAVQNRLKLNGTFLLTDVRFSSDKVQDRIRELSMRGLGNPKEAHSADASEVRSTMQGQFSMANGSVTLPALKYTVPGAIVDLKGTYGVDSGALDFAGTAKMQATVSQMVGGWKGMLIKPVDRYFKKDGAGTEVPIHIRGTREDPQFGVDLDRMKTTSPQRPDEPH
jgi:hypothetical protein